MAMTRGEVTSDDVPEAGAGWERRAFVRIDPDGGAAQLERALPVEAPVAVEVNGIGYAVLMATPDDLVDLAYGFLHAERLIDAADDLIDIDSHAGKAGIVLRITARPASAERMADRVRHRTSDSACGLCGVENLEQAVRPLPRLAAQWTGNEAAVFAAIGELRTRQPLNRATGAVHAAAFCSAEGAIVEVREDVGRHNAFDKLIGAMLRNGVDWNGGFALLSSRCSYELVEKAVLAGCPMLATISAPTTLAVQRATAAGLTLCVLARPDSVLVHRP